MNLLKIVVAVFLFSFGSAQAQRQVVIFKNTFERPLKQEELKDSNRLKKVSDNQPRRSDKKEKLKDFARNKGLTLEDRQLFVEGAVGFIATLTSDQIASFESDPQVQVVFQDFTIQGTRPRMQSRPRMQGEPPEPTDLYNPTTQSSCAIPLIGGSENSRKSSSIWILDSGVDGQHIDLNVNTNSMVSVSFVPEEPNALEDLHGHGTHCAGLAAGKGAGVPGVRGMSLGGEVISVKVLNSQGIGTWSQLILALDHVAKFGVGEDVVLMSLGSEILIECQNSDPIIFNMIQDLGQDKIFVIMSAGNNGANSNQNFPGCISGNNLMTIGALDFTCNEVTGMANYSNTGMPSIDYLAPGSSLFSSIPGNGYQVMSGTSMAAALVAGLVHSSGKMPKEISRVSFNGITYPVAGR